ncbi:MAG: efflux RND transporter periplasmic adaptor subunit [Endomicrobiales bacterium]
MDKLGAIVTYLRMHKMAVMIFLIAGVLIGFRVGVGFNNTHKISEDGTAKTSTVTNEAGSVTVHAPPGGFNPAYVSCEQVRTGWAPEQIPIEGKIAFNAEKLHLISARVSGRLDTIMVFEGARVEKDQALAEVYSPDFITAENEYILSLNTVRTFSESKTSDLLTDAKATEQSAINKLKVLGADDEDIANLTKKGVAGTHLIIRAPISGMVVKRTMDQGAYLNIGDTFMSVADTDELWFYGNIYEQDYSKVKIGQELELRAAALPGKKFSGRVSYIAPSIDPVSHILAIRCDVPNPGGELRPEIFVTAYLKIAQRKAVIVSKSAVIQIKDTGYVIVKETEDLYRRVPVTSMNLTDGRVAILSGLSGTESIVTKGAVLINNMIEQ